VRFDDVLRSICGGAGLSRKGSSGAKVDGPDAGSWVTDANGNVLVSIFRNI